VIDLHAGVLRQSFEQSDGMLLGGGLEKLEGALRRPEQHAHYEDADLAQQAAVLVHGIVEAHAFQDGNKRVALAALYTFLHANGFTSDAPKRLRSQWMTALATGTPPNEIAAEIRAHLVPLP
jgi:death-on-curing protein